MVHSVKWKLFRMVGVFLEWRGLGSYEAKGKYEAGEVGKGQIWKDTECYVNIFVFVCVVVWVFFVCFLSWAWYRAIKDLKQGNGIIFCFRKIFPEALRRMDWTKYV